MQFQIGGKVCNVQFSSFTVGFVQNILLVDTESCSLARIGKIDQFGLGSLGQVDTADDGIYNRECDQRGNFTYCAFPFGP